LLDPGQTSAVRFIGDFADQHGVILPGWYVNAQTLNSSVAVLSPDGLITGVASGDTVLVAARGSITAATAIGVGKPSDGRLLLSRLLGIDAYPGSITLLPEQGMRQIIVSLGIGQQTFVTEAANGTL
jgi:hypothetical protein